MSKRIAQILADKEIHCELEVQAWLRTKRVSKNCAFLAVNDGSCHSCLQLVVESANTKCFEDVAILSTGSSLRACGVLKPSPANFEKSPRTVRFSSSKMPHHNTREHPQDSLTRPPPTEPAPPLGAGIVC